MRGLIPFLTFVLAAAFIGPVAAQEESASSPPGARGSADYPYFDAAVAGFIDRGLTNRWIGERLATEPDDPRLPRLLIERDRYDEALASLQLIVERHPERMAEAFRLSAWRLAREVGTTQAALRLVAEARKRLDGLPREQAAWAARRILGVEMEILAVRDSAPRLRAFVNEYAGTDAALETEVDLIGWATWSSPQVRLDALLDFAASHPGTTAAAKIMFSRGSALAENSPLANDRDRDPRTRFNAVLAIVRSLQDGSYPPCEWVERAPELIVKFSTATGRSATEEELDSAAALYLDVIRMILPTLPAGISGVPRGTSVDGIINWTLGDIFDRRGDRIAGLEAVFATLERETANPADVRYAAALSYLTELGEPRSDEPLAIAKGKSALRRVHDAGVQPFARRALATLAALHLYLREFEQARSAYEAYLSENAPNEWTWLARIRLGQTDEALRDPAAAARAYMAAAATADVPSSGRAAALSLLSDVEAEQGHLDRSLRAAEQALTSWDDDFGQAYDVSARFQRLPDQAAFEIRDATIVSKTSLRARIGELRASLSFPGGAGLERGRRLTARDRAAEAIPVLRRALEEADGSSGEDATRRSLHGAQLLEALSRLTPGSSPADTAVAMEALAAIERDALDVNVIAARIARATILAMRPETSAQAEALMDAALREWAANQPSSPTPAAGTLEADVAAIREQIFRPAGDGIYAKGEQWNAFSWPQRRPPFLIADPDIGVRLANGAVQFVSLRCPIAGVEELLFLDRDDLGLLAKMIDTMGGRQQGPRYSVMQVNNPAGRARQIEAFWNRYFPMRRGHWSGWEFETYPQIAEIRFLDAARTRAAARVVIGYSGATVELVKVQGGWRAIGLGHFWVT